MGSPVLRRKGEDAFDAWNDGLCTDQLWHSRTFGTQQRETIHTSCAIPLSDNFKCLRPELNHFGTSNLKNQILMGCAPTVKLRPLRQHIRLPGNKIVTGMASSLP